MFQEFLLHHHAEGSSVTVLEWMETRPEGCDVENFPSHVRWKKPNARWAAYLLRGRRLVWSQLTGIHGLQLQPGQQPPGAHAGRPQPGGVLQPDFHEWEWEKHDSSPKRQEQSEKHGLLRADGISEENTVSLWEDIQPKIHFPLHPVQRHAGLERGHRRGRAAADRGAEFLGRAAVWIRKGPVPAALPVLQARGAPEEPAKEARGAATAAGAESSPVAKGRGSRSSCYWRL